MFENPSRGRQARNFTTNVPKILVLKSSSEQIFSRKLPLSAPDVKAQCTKKRDARALNLLFFEVVVIVIVVCSSNSESQVNKK